MNIRKAKEDDIPTIMKWAKEADELQTYAGDHLGKGFYEKIIKEGVSFVIELEDKMAGFLVAELDADLDFSYLTQLFVLPDQQGQGLGKMLIEAYLDKCKESGVAKVYLFAQEKNEKAIEFYNKQGFKKGKPYIAMYKEFK